MCIRDRAETITGLALRDIATGAPQRVTSYSLQDLGITLQGVAIAAVSDSSPALFAGVAAGDQVVMVNGKPAADLASLRITAPLLLLLQGVNGGTRHVMIDPWATGKTLRPVGGANVLDPDVVVF